MAQAKRQSKTDSKKKTDAGQPFIIGIAGGSGSGKTTAVENLIKTLDPASILCLSHDDYYRDQSHKTMQERVKTNYDHPAALETQLLVEHLQLLAQGQSVSKPIYDFTKHTRAQKTEKVNPKKIIVVEGILLFESSELRKMFDLKAFVDTPADIRILRRIKRDMEERGRTFEFVVDQYYTYTRPMHLQFVEPSKRYADIIIPEGGKNKAALELFISLVKQKLINN
ncbi:MAG: uridine kinase [Candidatus Pacebacteria bacterium]|nr:uridine kinase [Candidatus Paceibacterota bacterium]